MGKHAEKEPKKKKANFVWGIVHVLGYHHWRSVIKKMTNHVKHRGQSHDTCDWNPIPEIITVADDYETEELLHEQERSLYLRREKRSLGSRIKAFIVEEDSQGGGNMRSKDEGLPHLQRNNSIHHLESLDSNSGEICNHWNYPVILFPKSVESLNRDSLDVSQTKDETEHGSDEKPDVLEIFGLDKELLRKHLHDADEGIANFSRSALGLKLKANFSKSRSFPLPGSRKVKPVKLENKHQEVWSIPKEDKLQTLCSIDVKQERNDCTKKRIHRRSSSLNESLDKYTRLYDSMNYYQKDARLDACGSLRLANESSGSNARRMHTLSSIDSYYSNPGFEAWDDDSTGEGVRVSISMNDTENASFNENRAAECSVEPVAGSNMGMKEEDDAFLRLLTTAEEFGIFSNLKDEAESHLEELQIPPDLEEQTGNEGSPKLTPNGTEELKNDENSDKIMNSDLYYVRQVLDQSGLTLDALGITWHSPDKLLGQELFEQMEACWPHEQRDLTGLPDFHGCWHHQMLFDLVNEVLVDLYDVCLPYYPKPLSRNCHVPPFPKGKRLIKEVTASIGSLLNMEAEQQQSVECIVSHDQAHDLRWMNLQLENECIALDIEDMVFHELLDEVIFS